MYVCMAFCEEGDVAWMVEEVVCGPQNTHTRYMHTLRYCFCFVVYFIKNISRTSAVSSTNFWVNTHLPVQAALLVLVIYYMGEFCIGRGPVFCPLYQVMVSVGIFTVSGEF